MKKIFSACETINKPHLQVWNFFINMDENGIKWLPGVDEIRLESDKLKQGAEFSFKARGKTHRSLVSEFESGKKMTLSSTQGRFTADYKYTVEPKGENTIVTLDAYCKSKGFIILFSPFINLMIRRFDGKQIKQLKEAIER